MASETPPESAGLVLTAVVVLTRWRWRDFHRDVAELRQAGHVIDIDEGPGWLERTYVVTAELSVLNRLLGNREWQLWRHDCAGSNSFTRA